jgi:hypothetical protein
MLPWAGRHVLHDTGLVKETICFNVFVQKQWCSVANCGKVLHVSKTTHAYWKTSLSYQHGHNILLWMCQECSAIMARPSYKIRTHEIGNTWFTTTFPSLHFSIFCQITEFPYGPRHMGQPVLCHMTSEWELKIFLWFCFMLFTLYWPYIMMACVQFSWPCVTFCYHLC